MAGRIGNVLYWLGCIVAGLSVLVGVAAYVEEHNKSGGLFVTGFFIVVALVVWLVGRACRYVLSGH
jgi:hypothetical protein